MVGSSPRRDVGVGFAPIVGGNGSLLGGGNLNFSDILQFDLFLGLG